MAIPGFDAKQSLDIIQSIRNAAAECVFAEYNLIGLSTDDRFTIVDTPFGTAKDVLAKYRLITTTGTIDPRVRKIICALMKAPK